MKEGGVFKSTCSRDEKQVAGGCSSSKYCCCAPLDGKRALTAPCTGFTDKFTGSGLQYYSRLKAQSFDDVLQVQFVKNLYLLQCVSPSPRARADKDSAVLSAASGRKRPSEAVAHTAHAASHSLEVMACRQTGI